MRGHVAEVVRRALAAAIAAGDLPRGLAVPCRVAPPADPAFGDVACAAAIEVAREIGVAAPRVAAQLLCRLDPPTGWFASVEAAGPGFLNFRFALPFLRQAAAAVVAQPPTDGVATSRVQIVAGEGVTALERARLEAVAGALGALGAGRDPLAVQVMPAGKRAVEGAGRPVPVATVRAFQRGCRVDGSARGGDVLLDDRLRFLLLRAPVAEPVDVDLEAIELSSFESPAFAVFYALERVARLGRSSLAPGNLALLGEDARTLLRAIASWPDVLDDAQASLGPERVVQFATSVAAAIHGDYNRGFVMTDDSALARARRTLVQAAGGILEVALARVAITRAVRK